MVLSNNDGCVVARSNESKAMGIKMGTPFFKVRYLVEQEGWSRARPTTPSTATFPQG